MASSDQLSRGGIVVGVDGSPESLAAVDLAAREATLRGRPLQSYTAWSSRIFKSSLAPHPAVRLRANCASMPNASLLMSSPARDAAPTIEVTGEVITASGAQALISRSQSSSLVVVGDRGLGAFTGLLVGSVAIHVAAHATCPVLVARGTADQRPCCWPPTVPRPTTRRSDSLLKNPPCVAHRSCLHVWSHPASSGPGDMQPLVYDEAVVDAEEAGVLAEALAGWQNRYPNVAVRRWVVHGRVRKTIIGATRDAQLVVVGACGLGGFAGLLLGSVSQAVLRHAACPTAIVPHPHGR